MLRNTNLLCNSLSAKPNAQASLCQQPPQRRRAVYIPPLTRLDTSNTKMVQGGTTTTTTTTITTITTSTSTIKWMLAMRDTEDNGYCRAREILNELKSKRESITNAIGSRIECRYSPLRRVPCRCEDSRRPQQSLPPSKMCMNSSLDSNQPPTSRRQSSRAQDVLFDLKEKRELLLVAVKAASLLDQHNSFISTTRQKCSSPCTQTSKTISMNSDSSIDSIVSTGEREKESQVLGMDLKVMEEMEVFCPHCWDGLNLESIENRCPKEDGTFCI